MSWDADTRSDSARHLTDLARASEWDAAMHGSGWEPECDYDPAIAAWDEWDREQRLRREQAAS